MAPASDHVLCLFLLFICADGTITACVAARSLWVAQDLTQIISCNESDIIRISDVTVAVILAQPSSYVHFSHACTGRPNPLHSRPKMMGERLASLAARSKLVPMENANS